MNRSISTMVVGVSLLMSIPLVLAETHGKVQSALDWQLPDNNCDKPILAHAQWESFDRLQNTTIRYDVDYYKVERYERKMVRWNDCVAEYKQVLAADFETLESSAQYGLTRTQADTILGKMALIQAVLRSPEGVLEETVAEETAAAP